MLKKLSKIWSILICLILISIANGQVTPANLSLPSNIGIESETGRTVLLDDSFASLRAMVSRNNSSPSENRKFPKYFNSIAINREDVNKYHELLNGSDTGIVRLHDFSNCKLNKKNCAQGLVGQGSSYSFQNNVYTDKLVADILFENASFHIEGLNTLGFISNLGNLPLDSSNLTTAGIKEMAEFEPSSQLAEAESHVAAARNGFQVGNFIYKTSLSLKEESTYVFRSIVFRVISKTQNTNRTDSNGKRESRRRDIIVVFRVIRKHKDGSISLLWKKLQDKESPTIEVEESK